jgi:hypothetical protein
MNKTPYHNKGPGRALQVVRKAHILAQKLSTETGLPTRSIERRPQRHKLQVPEMDKRWQCERTFLKKSMNL